MIYACKYKFTRDEIRELGEQLARRAQDVYTSRTDLANVSAALKAQIKAAESELESLARRINNGYEMRDMECVVEFNAPRKGVKTIVRSDNGETMAVETMTPADMQSGLPFEGKGKTQ